MKVIILVALLSIKTLAQFYFGATMEGTGLVTDKTSYMIPVPIHGFGLIVGYTTFERYHIETRFSQDFLMSEYRGENYGLYIMYDLKPIYLSSNISLHANKGSSDEGILMTNVVLAGAGIGMEIIPHIALEVNYDFPLENKPWIEGINSTTQTIYFSKITGVLKVNFRFHTNL